MKHQLDNERCMMHNGHQYVNIAVLEITPRDGQVTIRGVRAGGKLVMPWGCFSVPESTWEQICAAELRECGWTVEKEIKDQGG